MPWVLLYTRNVVFLYCLFCNRTVHASIIAQKLCVAYRSLFDQAFFSIIAAFSFAGILWNLAIDEGDRHLKTKILRVGIGILGLVNIDQLVSLFTGKGLLC